MMNRTGKAKKYNPRWQIPGILLVAACIFLLLFLGLKGIYPISEQAEAAVATMEGPGSGLEEDIGDGEKLPIGEGIGDGENPPIGKGRRPKPIPEDWEISIISVGDIMMHSPQTRAGWQADSGRYDFSFMFEKIAPILRDGDLVIGNLETPLAGEANGGFTGYPLFNAPEALAQNLREAGFTLVSTANNHTLDRRYQGLCTTLDHLDAVGLFHTGSFRTAEERDQILSFEVKGVRFAVIAATYGTNGLTLPADHQYAVYYIDEALLLSDIQRARQEGAQYVIVMLHWGVEYQPRPSQTQTTLAAKLLRGGADMILGHHPHVLQRGEVVHLAELYASDEWQNTAPGDGLGGAAQALERHEVFHYRASGKAQEKFVVYSQGNFVSNQEGMERLSSMILKLTLGVDGATGEPYLKDAGYIPIYTQKRNRQGVSHHIVWPLELAMEELEKEGNPFGAEDRAAIPRAWAHVVNSQPGLDLWGLRDSPYWAVWND